MTRYLTLFAIIIMSLPACQGKKIIAERIEGTYYGYLPCASCPGIFYDLRINPDFTYSSAIQYDGADEVFINEDSYRITGDTIIVLQGNTAQGMSRFAYSNEMLEMLSTSGEKIESGFPDRYILAKTRPPVSHDTVPAERAAFRATGNEPFWSIEIELHNVIKFTSLTEKYPELLLPAQDPKRAGDLSHITYTAKTYNAEMEVSISREKCTDTMKGNTFPYSVEVSIRKNQTADPDVFRGCGRYLGNYRLNNIWTLVEINGVPVIMPAAWPLPTLEVDLGNKVIFGYGGCNRFHGKADLVNNTLVTGSLVSTKMACPSTQDIETRFLRALSGKRLTFSIDEEGMLLITDGTSEMLFIAHP